MTTRDDRRRSLPAVALMLMLTACGPRIPREQALAANGGLRVGEVPSEASSATTVPGGAAEAPAGGADVASPTGGTTPSSVPAGGPPGVRPGTGNRSAAPASAPAASTATTPGTGPSAGSPTGSSPAAGGEAKAPAVTAGCSTQETGPILIGTVGNYSGIAASSMIPMVRPVQAWAQEVNSRGGLCGREVKLIVVDDKSDPAQHRAALQDLVENRRVIAFVSNAAVLTSTAGIPYLESAKVPVFGSSCSVEREFQSPMYFLPCPTVSDLYFATARTAALFGGDSKKWGLIYCREAEVCNGAYRVLIDQGGAKEAGVDVVHAAQTSIVQPDYTSECLSAQRSGAEKIFAVLDLASIGRFVNSCSRQGYNPTYVQVSSSVDATTKDLPKMHLVVATGSFSFAARSTPAEQQFQAVVAKYLGTDSPGPGESQGWTNVKLFEAAATRAAQAARSMTPATLIAALNGFRGETLDGLSVPLTFPAGAAGRPDPCFWVSEASARSPWVVLRGGKMLCRGRD